MANILYSQPLIDKELPLLQKKVLQLKKRKIYPKLAILMVGNNPASVIYTQNKKKFCEQLGIECQILKLSSKCGQKDFVKFIKELVHHDNPLHGLIVQLPLPQTLQKINLTELIPPHLDVDGFGSYHIGKIFRNDIDSSTFIPCTPKGIIQLFNHYKIKLEGKNIVIIGRSLIVGKPLSLLMTNHNATVSLCHSKTNNLKEFTRRADIIVTALGISQFLKTDFLDPKNKRPIIIDVGINKDLKSKKVTGDADFENLLAHVEAITPVPGGIGPLTILSLIQNLLQAAEKGL